MTIKNKANLGETERFFYYETSGMHSRLFKGGRGTESWECAETFSSLKTEVGRRLNRAEEIESDETSSAAKETCAKPTESEFQFRDDPVYYHSGFLKRAFGAIVGLRGEFHGKSRGRRRRFNLNFRGEADGTRSRQK